MAFEFEVAVIGGGSGGYAAARTAAEAGLKTVVIDGAQELGGLCILRGCMPTKALLFGAEVFHMTRQAGIFGVRSAGIELDYPALLARKNRLIDDFAAYRVGQLHAGKFALIKASARFLDPHTLELSDGRRVSAGHFILATGSVNGPSPLEALEEVGYLTSDEALRLPTLPQSMIVLGGGAVAVEFAQFFCRCGVQVTLIQRSGQLLKEEDADAAEVLAKVLRREGVTIFTGTRLENAWKEGGQKVVTFLHEGQTVRVAAEEILFALGRVPNTRGLGLENAGIALEYGRFKVDAQMRTNMRHIYAVGDVAGVHEIVHIAIQQGELAAHQIARPERSRAMDYRLLTSVIFTEPQLARVGLTEREATARGIPVLSASYPFADHGKSMIMEALDGFVKLLADPVTGEILGGACTGPHGGELIHEIVAAMHGRMTVQQLAAMPHYHPTLAEIWTYPAEELAGRINPPG